MILPIPRPPIRNPDNRQSGIFRVDRSSILRQLLAGAALAAPVASAVIDDLRDLVEPIRGTPVRGRVLNPYSEDEIVILQGDKRIRVKRSDTRSITTVNDHLREFFERYEKVSGDADRLWGLSAWASEMGLGAMARLVALQVVLRDPEHEAAHEALGHRPSSRGWLWRRGERFMPKEQFDQYVSDWGHALELDSEHWTLRTNADLRRGVEILFDLERLYFFVHDAFGRRLDLHEAVEPMPMFVWKEAENFPGKTAWRHPYYVTAGTSSGEGGYTYFEEGAERPRDLFRVGTESILNVCLADRADSIQAHPDVDHRLVAWFEVGFGQWIESQLEGSPGWAQAVPTRVEPDDARLVLRGRRYRLTGLLTRGVRDTYGGAVGKHTEADWAYPHLFVAFLMEDGEPDGTAERLLRYGYETMRLKKGVSSKVFDNAMGRKIETLERPFEAWLRARADLDVSKR